MRDYRKYNYKAYLQCVGAPYLIAVIHKVCNQPCTTKELQEPYYRLTYTLNYVERKFDNHKIVAIKQQNEEWRGTSVSLNAIKDVLRKDGKFKLTKVIKGV